MSHEQATVERGFSVNKEVEAENSKEHTLVAQRIVCDHVTSVEGVLKIELSKPLLLSVKMSRQRYEQHLDQERHKKKTELERSKRKWKRSMKSKRRRESTLRLSHSMTQPMNFVPK